VVLQYEQCACLLFYESQSPAASVLDKFTSLVRDSLSFCSDSWKEWSSLNKATDEKATSYLCNSALENTLSACNSGEVREMQRKKAEQVASACSGGKNKKATRMFQVCCAENYDSFHKIVKFQK